MKARSGAFMSHCILLWAAHFEAEQSQHFEIAE
jgi:hypothetical protein